MSQPNDLDGIMEVVEQAQRDYASRALLAIEAGIKPDMYYHQILDLIQMVREVFCEKGGK